MGMSKHEAYIGQQEKCTSQSKSRVMRETRGKRIMEQ